MSLGGTPPTVADGPLRVQAIPAITAPAMPRIAPSRLRAAAVAAVIIRRVMPLAPVAVSVRRSGAVSLRIRPTDPASTLSAITMPSAVAPSAKSSRLGLEVSVWTCTSLAFPNCRTALSCVAVSGAGAWISHPCRLGCMWYLLTAYSVSTVFGADVPLGRLPTVAIAGLARQPLLSVQGGPPSLPGSAGALDVPGEQPPSFRAPSLRRRLRGCRWRLRTLVACARFQAARGWPRRPETAGRDGAEGKPDVSAAGTTTRAGRRTAR